MNKEYGNERNTGMKRGRECNRNKKLWYGWMDGWIDWKEKKGGNNMMKGMKK